MVKTGNESGRTADPKILEANCRPARCSASYEIFPMSIGTSLVSALLVLLSPALGKELPLDASFEQRRIQSAQQLIQEGEAYIARTRALHERTGQQILAAKRLRGQAEVLRTITPTAPSRKLSPKEYQAALEQFNSDVAKFRANAIEYNQHLEKFRLDVGECQANEATYQSIARRYELHCKQFHLPNIPAPHICVTLNLTEAQAASLAHVIRLDQVRVAQAERDLRQEEARLSHHEGAAPYLEAKLKNQTERQQREQKLAEEFATLKQEYDLLEIERKVIATNGKAKSPVVVRSSVAGRVKKEGK